MQDFDNLMKQAVSLKTGQMLQKRRNFEVQPLFIKAGLYFLVKHSNVRRQGFFQRFAVCEHLKTRGNKLFKEEKSDLAAREYEQAISIFRYILNKNPNWKNEGIIDEDLEYVNYEGEDVEEKALLTTIKAALYNNLAACYINIGDVVSAKAACTEALLLDPTQTKALYRRAKALTSEINAGPEEFNLAIEDIKRALVLSPDDKVLQQTLVKIKHDLAKMKNSSQAFKGIFQTDKKKQGLEGDLLLQSQQIGNSSEKSDDMSTRTSEKSIETVEGGKAEDKKNVKTVSEGKSDKENKAQKMLNTDSSSTASSSSSQPNANDSIPKEIGELEQFIEHRGRHLLRIYESSGRIREAEELKENLKKAMAAKQRLERIATIDFSQPTEESQEVADKFGLDLNDPLIKEELKRIQTQNLQDIRDWINGGDPSKGIKPEKKKKSKVKKEQDPNNEIISVANAANAASTTNNYYINNNYYRSADSQNKTAIDPISKTKIVENIKEQDKNSKNKKMLNELVENVNKLSATDTTTKTARIVNLSIAALAIGLFLMTLYMQATRNNTATPRQDTIKEI